MVLKVFLYFVVSGNCPRNITKSKRLFILFISCFLRP